MSGCVGVCDRFLGDRLEVRVAIPLFGHTEILHTLIRMGGAALEGQKNTNTIILD